MNIPKVNFTLSWNAYNKSWGIHLSWGMKDQPLKEGETIYKHCIGVSIVFIKY